MRALAGLIVLGLVFSFAEAAAEPPHNHFDPDRQPVAPTPSIAPARPDAGIEPELEPGRGFIPPPFDLPEPLGPAPTLALPLAARFDWRDTGKVTPVKNQGSCGACYAFAVAGNIESVLLIGGESAYDFSENNLKECEYYGSSCSGGNYWREANLLSTVGTVLESCDPYVAGNVDCNGACASQVNLLDWREFSHDTLPSVATIKSYLQTYGPIYTSMNAGHGDAWAAEFNAYNGSYTLYTTATGASNHAVLLVGWDDNLTHAGGQGAWIVKNSWGTSWGGTCGYGTERGYFAIAYGSANVGTWSSFCADWQYSDPDGSLLYYDEAGYTSAVGYGSTTAWGLVKYIPGEDVLLKRVEFWSADATTDVDVYIYDNFGASPSGLITSELNSSFDLPGYHSVELASAPRITAGNDVYVVVKFTDVSYNYPLIYDSAGPKSSGTSYISYNGSAWTAWTAGDLGLRLRVTADGSCGAVGDEPVLAEVEDVPSDNGGHVRLAWSRSAYDQESASPQIKRYRIWRMKSQQPLGLAGALDDTGVSAGPVYPGEPRLHDETGAVWEVVGVVGATGQCSYSFIADTPCDSSAGGRCWTSFFVSAHTGRVGQHFDSPVDSGYSVDNLLAQAEGEDRGRPIPYGPDTAPIKVTSLGRPEPNPGPGNFVIRYELAAPGWLALDVYDVRGRRVAALAEGRADAGRYVARWDGRLPDGSAAASGMYFVRLATESGTHIAKIVLVR